MENGPSSLLKPLISEALLYYIPEQRNMLSKFDCLGNKLRGHTDSFGFILMSSLLAPDSVANKDFLWNQPSFSLEANLTLSVPVKQVHTEIKTLFN